MVVEAPQINRGLKLPKGSDFIAKGIDVVTPERTLDTFSSLFQYTEAKGYREGVLHYLALGYYPIGVFNHYVHSDGFAYVIASENLINVSMGLDDPSKRVQGCYGLHQGTIEGGEQGEDLKTYTLKLKDAAGKRGLIYMPWTTPDHVKRYKLIDAQKEEVKKQNAESSAKMMSAPNERIALLTFPAGNMKSARDPLKGMVGSDLNWITQMAMFLREGVKIVWLPGVIQESFRISDPDTHNLTPEGAWSFARNFLARSTLPVRPSEAKLASLTMLPPYPIDRLAADLTKITENNIDAQNLRTMAAAVRANRGLTDRLIMGIIYDELPENRKGNHYGGYKSFSLGNYAEALYP